MPTLSRHRGSPETPRRRPRSVAPPAAGAARLGLRERGKLDKRERIRAAACELFSSHGVEAATLRQIAERAQVALGTLFNYENAPVLCRILLRDMYFYSEGHEAQRFHAIEGRLRDHLLTVVASAGARCDTASGATAGKPSAHQHPAPLAHGEKQGGRRWSTRSRRSLSSP
jgi:hypothetical protein